MTTITIQKIEYRNILKTQDMLMRKIDSLEEMVRESFYDEVNPKYAGKLEQINREMDKGKGLWFSDAQEMKKWLKSL